MRCVVPFHVCIRGGRDALVHACMRSCPSSMHGTRQVESVVSSRGMSFQRYGPLRLCRAAMGQRRRRGLSFRQQYQEGGTPSSSAKEINPASPAVSEADGRSAVSSGCTEDGQTTEKATPTTTANPTTI